MSGKTKVAPCPKCGNEFPLVHRDGEFGCWAITTIECLKCGHKAKGTGDGSSADSDSKREAVARWNGEAIKEGAA